MAAMAVISFMVDAGRRVVFSLWRMMVLLSVRSYTISPMLEVWRRGDEARRESILPAADVTGTGADDEGRELGWEYRRESGRDIVELSAAEAAGIWDMNEAINANIKAKILFIGCKITQKSSNKQKITQLFYVISIKIFKFAHKMRIALFKSKNIWF